MMRLTFSLLTAMALLSSSVPGLRAQSAAKDNRTFEVRTNLLVVDDKNRIVEGIKQSEVKIFENDVEQKLTYFSVKESILNVVILVDNSGSVREQLPKITNMGKLLAANLFPTDEATVIRFVGREHIEVVESWTNDKKLLSQAIDNLFIEGGQSAVIDALYLSGQELLKRHKAASDRKYAIVLLSDGEDRDSYYNEKQLLNLLADTDVQIFKIFFIESPPKKAKVQGVSKLPPAPLKLIDNLTVKTGGTSLVFARDDTEKVNYADTLKALMQELRSHIVLGYTAQNVEKGNLTRKLTATVADGPNGEKRKGIIKETITLPTN